MGSTRLSHHVEVTTDYPCLIKKHAMKTYEGVEVSFQVFLTSALDWCELSASRSNSFTPGEKAAGMYGMGD
jgi:hypothetical protein